MTKRNETLRQNSAHLLQTSKLDIQIWPLAIERWK